VRLSEGASNIICSGMGMRLRQCLPRKQVSLRGSHWPVHWGSEELESNLQYEGQVEKLQVSSIVVIGIIVEDEVFVVYAGNFSSSPAPHQTSNIKQAASVEAYYPPIFLSCIYRALLEAAQPYRENRIAQTVAMTMRGGLLEDFIFTKLCLKTPKLALCLHPKSYDPAKLKTTRL
jgi:hypothetical protein